MATLVAIALALRSGYAVSGLVLVSGYYFPTARTDFWLTSAPAMPLLGDLMRYTSPPIISWAIMPKLMRTLFAPRAIPPEFKNEFPISLALRPKQLRAAAEESAFLIPAAAQLRLQYRVSGVQLGSCMERLTGSSRPTSRRLHAVLPSSLLHLVEDAGHMVTYADAAGIADAVAALAPSAPVRTA